MGKNNGNGNASAAMPPTIHLVLQGKGGIGKSVVASWLTEFLSTRGQKVCAIDADPVNRLCWASTRHWMRRSWT